MEDEQATQQRRSAARLLKLSVVLLVLGVVVFVAAAVSRVGGLLFLSLGLLGVGMVLGPLAYIDAVSASGSALEKKPVRAALVRFPIRIVGLLALALGLGLLVWIPLNLFVARSEYFTGGWESLLTLDDCLAIVAIGWWWLRGAKGHRPH